MFVPVRAATLAADVRREWASGLELVAGVDGAAVTGLLDEDEHAFLANMLVQVHARPAGKVRPRPPLEESYRRHESLVAELAPLAGEKGLPVAWHALWRLPREGHRGSPTVAGRTPSAGRSGTRPIAG